MLTRFYDAQKNVYDEALEEVRKGKKRTHWMWFIFPQLKGLGSSTTANYYGIDGIAEAEEYLAEDVLKARLIEISEALLGLDTDDARVVFGSPDNLKLKSCMTLFYVVDNGNAVFKDVLDKFFDGKMDNSTIRLLKF